MPLEVILLLSPFLIELTAAGGSHGHDHGHGDEGSNEAEDGGSSHAGGDVPKNAVLVHAIMVTTAWGLLIPNGIIMAILKKTTKDKKTADFYYQVHRSVQVLGLALTVAGFIVIYGGVSDSHGAHFHGFHTLIGALVLLLVLFQPVNAIMRPAEDHKNRAKWNNVHKKSGYLVGFLGFGNLFVGAFNSHLDSGELHGVRSLILPLIGGCVLITIIVKIAVGRGKDNSLRERTVPESRDLRAESKPPELIVAMRKDNLEVHL